MLCCEWPDLGDDASRFFSYCDTLVSAFCMAVLLSKFCVREKDFRRGDRWVFAVCLSEYFLDPISVLMAKEFFFFGISCENFGMSAAISS